ncbi:ABC transporter permease subunit [Microbacterium sp. lyk4-40-TSB-66]|uniref:ABC transporter permease n=1 Tax=Microbacterium sp. lyk4-40-TSB-66 TaxID=3040294 RepID=UPI00254F3B71|nr:ABC transporter permease subunit [Microbacterium sp. lyk4-40-TSB-66]
MNTTPIRGVLWALSGLAALLLAWHVVAVTLYLRDNGSPGPIPPPLSVLNRAVTGLVEGAYIEGLTATAGAAVAGYVIAVAIALTLGVLVMVLPALGPLAAQLGVVTACAPAAAIAPIVVLLTPSGSRGVSIVLAMLAVEFPLVVGVLLGLRSAAPSQIDLVHAYGGSAWTAIRKVRLISALPAMLASLKIAAPAAFLGAMTGEFFTVGVDRGAGRLLISQQYVGDYSGMWAIALLATLVSAAGYGAIALAGRLVAPWTSHVGSVR